MSVDAALARLLAGTGYVARRVGQQAWRIERERRTPAAPARPAPGPMEGETAADPIVVPVIVVTAGKREQAMDALPLSVAVVRPVGARAFDPSRDTAAIAGEVEGLSLTSMGPGRNRMFLRGVSDSPFNGESQSTVAVVLDEARLTFSAPDPDVRLVDVERAEVIKGPQGSLYGTGALGGIYHIVTRRADLDEKSLSVLSGTEMPVDGGPGWSASAVANLPLVRDTIAIRLVGYSARESGWVDTGSRGDANVTRVLGARAGLGAQIGEQWRLDVTGFLQLLESRDSQYVYEPRQRSRPGQLAEPHDNDLRHASARLARQVGSTHIVVSSGYTSHEVVDEQDATIGAGSFGLPDPQLLDIERQYRVWDNEVRINGTFGRLTWLAGVSHISASQDELWTLSSDTDSLVIDEDRRTTRESALFGDVTLPLGSAFRINGGARLFRSKVRETRVIAGERQTRHHSKTGLTPSAALSWQPHPGRLAWVRFGSAIRQGGSDISPSGKLEVINDDELATIEAGWRERVGRDGRIEFGAWHSWWKDMQSDLLEPDGRFETANVGNAVIYGFEASADLSVAQGWRLQAGGNWMHARIESGKLGIDVEDSRLPAIPAYTLRAALQHDFAIGRADASFRLQLRYVGPSRLSFQPELDRPMGKVLETRIEGRLKLDGFEAAIAVENFLDRKSDTFSFGNSLRLATMEQFTPQQPASVSLVLSKGF